MVCSAGFTSCSTKFSLPPSVFFGTFWRPATHWLHTRTIPEPFISSPHQELNSLNQAQCPLTSKFLGFATASSYFPDSRIQSMNMPAWVVPSTPPLIPMWFFICVDFPIVYFYFTTLVERHPVHLGRETFNILLIRLEKDRCCFGAMRLKPGT